MRIQTEDTSFAPHNAGLELQDVTVPAGLAKADLWFRFIDAEQIGQTEVWCYRTRDEAVEETPPGSWVGHKVFSRGVSPQLVDLTMNAASLGSPISIQVQNHFSVEDPGVVWSSVPA